MTSIEWVPSDQSEWLWRSPRRSPRSMSFGSLPASAASISPWSSRSSGSMNGQAEEGVRLRLRGEGPELGGVPGERLAILADPQEPLLGQAPALVAGPLAEADVVLLGPREVDPVRAGLAGRHDHEVGLRAAQQADRRLVAALVDDVVDHPEGREPLDEARAVVGLGEDVEVADASPGGAGTTPRARSIGRRARRSAPPSGRGGSPRPGGAASVWAPTRAGRCPRGSAARSWPTARAAV